MNAIPAAAGLLLAFGTGTPAAPISSDGPFGPHGADWTIPEAYPPRLQFWGHRHGHRSHGLDLQALLRQYRQGGRGTVGGPWGFGHGNEEDPVSAWLCGGAYGAGGTQDQSDASPLQDDGSDPGDGEGSPAILAADLDTNPSQPGIPAVPEPGSLALLGAGALGLLTARALLKKS